MTVRELLALRDSLQSGSLRGWGANLCFLAVFSLFMGLVAITAYNVRAQDAKDMLLVLTEVENLKLQNLQLRAQSINAEFQAENYKLLNEERNYVEEVAKAHPGIKATFDFQGIKWVQHPAPEDKK
jgi:hypothetical protein